MQAPWAAHAFWNAGDTTARMLKLISPSGLEELFRELDVLTDRPALALLAEMAGRYGRRARPRRDRVGDRATASGVGGRSPSARAGVGRGCGQP